LSREIEKRSRSPLFAGAMLYLVGLGLFKHTLRGRWPPSHLVGLGLQAALGFVARSLPRWLSD
jgi:hypothetical protein